MRHGLPVTFLQQNLNGRVPAGALVRLRAAHRVTTNTTSHSKRKCKHDRLTDPGRGAARDAGHILRH